MRKLTYAIALSSLLLAGCSQDEGIMENKGELVTLNYNVSLGNDVQSRADGGDLVVNKLLCEIYELTTDENKVTTKKVVKRDYRTIKQGETIEYTPSLFKNSKYRIVFWAYYEDANGRSCFNLDNLESITVNDLLYDKENFTENKYKDAFTQIDNVAYTGQNTTKTIKLSRPFSMVNIYTSKADYAAAVAMGSTPTTGSINIQTCPKTYNAFEHCWMQDNNNAKLLYTEVSPTPIINARDDKEWYCLASEYVFANGTVGHTQIQMKAGDKTIYDSAISNMPLNENVRTNLFNEMLLTGGGVTYSITIDQGFSDSDKTIESNKILNENE